MNIEHYISDLLYEYDCVIIPGLGGFIGNYTPARVNPVHHNFFPPYKSLLFNINLKQNDGLLANRIVQDAMIPYEDAMESIRSFVNHCKSLLKEGRKIRLENIGILYIDNKRTLQFDQEKETNYLLESYGLTSFVSLPVLRHGLQLGIEKQISRYSNLSVKGKRSFSKSLKWAAFLAFPIGAAILLGITNFDKIKNIPVSYSGLFYTTTSNLTPPVPSPKKVKMSLQSTGETLILNSIDPPVPEIRPARMVSHEASKLFGIIVGAFKIHQNAERLVADLHQNGHDALIFDETRTGLFRVSIQNYSNKDEALTALAIIRASEFPAAWLLEK
jgi:nucleoid DNA-binding protein